MLISLLDSFDRPLPNLQFQKILFLYCQELRDPRAYEFVPYRFGAFSFTSYADRRKLIRQGLLVDQDQKWQLTPDGKRAATGSRQPDVSRFADRYRTVSEDLLVSESYRRYPYYATRSEVVGNVLRGDQVALDQIEAARTRPIPGTLLTIGYEARSLEGYLNLLLQAGVSILCDVRQNAVSRKYGFAQSTLSNACTGIGLRYEHLPELGISAERRKALRHKADYRRLFREYTSHDLPRQLPTLATLVHWIRSDESVALTCFERNPSDCHRSKVAEELHRQARMPRPTRHL